MESDNIAWLGHASFAINSGDTLVYIDPFRLDAGAKHADVVLVTHPHFDHFSVEDIKKVTGPDTEIFVPKDSVNAVSFGRVIGVEPNKDYSSHGVRFSTLPAYNTEKERMDFHPKANGWVGYILEANKMSIYYPGDTDNIGELERLDVDMALLPIGGTYTMDVDQAIAASKRIKAGAFAPMHYKAVLGKERAHEAEQKFLKSVRNSKLLKEAKEPYYSFD